MTKEDKRSLFCKLLDSRPYGDGPAKLAKWCRSSPSTIYLWQKSGGPWPREEKETRLWAFFDYVLDERGNPTMRKQEQEVAQPLPPEQEALPTTQTQPQLIANITRDMMAVLQRYVPQLQLTGVVKETRDLEQRELSNDRPANTPHRRRGEDRRTRTRRAISGNKSKINPATTKAPAKDD